MSMYRQLWMALILTTVLALAGSLLASTLSARDYMREQLRVKNADNASALALSLRQSGIDSVEVELAVAAMFDTGHYESIRVLDPAGKLMIERVAAPARHAAPDWFVQRLPLIAPPGRAQISDGWKQIGTVVVSSQSRFAYDALWKSTGNMVLALLLAGLLSGALGTMILRRLRAPLDRVIEQARAISERRFVTTPEPQVPELKQLAAAMNYSVERLKAMFDEEAKRLEAVRREANFDSLTGLANRAYFMGSLRASMDADDAKVSSLLLLRVANLSNINRTLGRGATDDLLKLIGKTVEHFAVSKPESLAARLNGADFGLLLDGEADSLAAAQELLHSLIRDTSAFLGDQPVAFIGAGRFSPGQEPGAMLAQVDAALASAEASGGNAVSEATPMDMDESPRSAEQWSLLIQHALAQRWVRLVSFPVADFSGRLIHRECPLRLKFSVDGEWLAAGRFLPVAERLGMTAALDVAAVTLGLEQLARERTLPGLAINLSARSVKDEGFRRELRALLGAQPEASRRLWLEVAEHGALAHFDAFRRLCHEIKATGCRIGLEHFGRQFSQIGQLHDLGLDYLKVDSSFVRDIENNPGNQAFLKGLTSIARNIGLQVFAEGVTSEAELNTLADLGFNGATGPAVRDRI